MRFLIIPFWMDIHAGVTFSALLIHASVSRLELQPISSGDIWTAVASPREGLSLRFLTLYVLLSLPKSTSQVWNQTNSTKQVADGIIVCTCTLIFLSTLVKAF